MAWPIWHTLLEIIKSYNISLTMSKVQAHAEYCFNNLADSLARQHDLAPSLSFNYTNIFNPHHILSWENTHIEHISRKFIKNICRAHVIAIWSSQHRANEWSNFAHYIDWDSTWL